jgi:hypothetical protein
MVGYTRSLIVWRSDPGGPGDTPFDILSAVVARLRAENAREDTKARELSLAITHCEEATHWLAALADRRKGSA